MDYSEILEQLVSGDRLEYRVDPQENPEAAFDFQQSLRNYGKNKKITGRAGRGGVIIYTSIDNKPKY
ncbi:hypothetical protein lacNasYZ03_08570 [Lactobacillus nasalidis]|uniref:Uncharacterized protein n=1 Tax=Lactobacillus nasalidis TaxID=2797258 RepID=A0ABQ3W759_9LACO|nr:hypothetical protein [Lactobacillus nasalidis]GHV96943.1 hypothetical protein lacNasYZ01_01250 [Lactobacillus nasalidis]GHW00191.1 hypothetical protein lacNasYZ02_16200 [Lactobacillus nasalidis]GHW01170.1 hypothetical protein lacNasYZ03_08570 [Lactobacillus nasalidis]